MFPGAPFAIPTDCCGSNAMDASANITAAVFAAYLKCPTKAYLTAHGENPPDTFVADTRAHLGRVQG